ncbi:MAG: hypothetical protein H6695_03405 [Deferribacteres bacterium]|nr:hypothetical protein [candidate division KSB1 bacterium]MCB9509195.1 hypothetical protein [Deferribacteres bacterium]
MRLNAPKQIVWTISVVLGVLGLIGKFTTIAVLSANAFWLVLAGFVILAASTVLKGV